MPRSWQRRRASGSVMFESTTATARSHIVTEFTDFKAGKLYPHDRPALGFTLYIKPLTQIGVVTRPVRRQIYSRQDGSLTHCRGPTGQVLGAVENPAQRGCCAEDLELHHAMYLGMETELL